MLNNFYWKQINIPFCPSKTSLAEKFSVPRDVCKTVLMNLPAISDVIKYPGKNQDQNAESRETMVVRLNP